MAGIQNNSWITIRGSNLAPTSRAWDAAREIIGGKLPMSLDGVSVSVNGKPAGLYYISPTQINVLTPSDSAIGPVSVTVANSNGISPAFSAQMQRYSPAFFVFDLQGGRYAAATMANGAYVGPPGLFGAALITTPAKPHDTVVLYGTGFGGTTPPVPADSVFNGAAPLIDRVVVTIGGLAANTQFAGMSGAGLCQFNVEVPDAADGDQPLTATIGGVRTQANVFIAVKR